MKTLPLSEVKMKLSGLVEEVKNTDEEILITKNGAPAAVLVSPEEYEGWKETARVRANSSLMAEIRKGVEALKRKRTRLYTLTDLFE